jgi:perosamine synthetase
MYFAIPRGRISHPITAEVKDLIHSTFFPLKCDPLIRDYEEAVGTYLQTAPPMLFPFARTGFFAILELLRLPAGSKVLMPTITIKPLLDVALHFNLIPILVDLDVKTGCWEPKSLEIALKQKPKVALLTYLFGVVPNLEEILPRLFEENITVIEDFSQAFGARFNGVPLGTLGDFGICSTSSTKTFDTYGGALVFFRTESHRDSLLKSRNRLMKAKRSTLIKKILKNLMRNVGTNKLVFGLITFPLILAVNSRSKQKVGKFTGDRSLSPLSELPGEWFEGVCAFQAKVGIRELSLQIDKDRKRILIANRYSQELRTLGPRGDIKGHSVYWQYISVENQPISFRDFLNSKFVDCATTSLVKLSELSNYGLAQKLSGSDAIYSSGVYLPCYHQLSYREQTRVIRAVRTFYEGQ